jgi:hypothetical protein
MQLPGGGSDSPLARFLRGMRMDLDRWRDGVGHDLAALAEASAEERRAIEQVLLSKRPRTWREIEALAALDTPPARRALREALEDADPQVRAAVIRVAPTLVSDAERTRLLVEALGTAEFYGGLSQTLDEVAEWHPPEVVAALWRGAAHRSGEVAVHFAAMLAWVYGKAAAPFDWEQRPLFLRFNTDDPDERQTALQDLVARLGAERDAGASEPGPG